MIRLALVALPPVLLATPAAAQTSSGLWNYHYQNGIGEYLTGAWDSPTGSALNISCLPGGQVAIMAQIKGQAPPAGSALVLVASSRAGSSPSRFVTDLQGSVRMPASGATFRKLWADLRARDIVTIRYSDGRSSVQSLSGARRLLPVTPCG